MPLSRVWIPSPNYSSRGGTKVRLVVVHTAEGALTYQSLGSFFANPASGVSSHTGIDDTPNTCGEYVRRDDGKAWTQGNANPYSTATELCAFAAWTRADWLAHPGMLDNCSRWIAEECAHFGIPKVRLTAAQAQGGGAGVCGHVDLGAAGGGHWDPGPDFPWDVVLGGTTPTPAPKPKEVRMFLARATTDSSHDKNIKTGYAYVVTDNGLVPVATSPDMANMAKQLGPEVGLTGNQLWGFNQTK